MQNERHDQYSDDHKIINVVSPTGFGSLGDQAMLDALTTKLTQYAGKEVKLLRNIAKPSRYILRSPISYVNLPNKKIPRTFSFAWNIARGAVFSMIGADIIDGSYSPRAILQWLRMARVAHATGSRCIILGSSCSQSPSPAVMAALKRLAFIKVLARDPISQRRFSEHLDRDVELVADLAFLLQGEVSSPNAHAAEAWISTQKMAGRTILGVNVSAETVDKVGRDRSIQSYIDVLRSWIEKDPSGRSILCLPHDFRGMPPRDAEALAAIEAGLRDETRHIHFIRPPFEAWDAKALAGQVDVMFAGRMHLAIASFGMGTPVLSVAYQGKFEGLMKHLELEREELLLQRDELLDERRLLRALEAVTARSDDLRCQITAKMPKIIQLASKNIEIIRIMSN